MKQVSILLVSGNAVDYAYLHDLLSHTTNIQCEVEWADSFDSGLLALRKGKFDIALVDDDLGIRKGSQFVLNVEQNGIDLPIILFACGECWDGDEAAFQSRAVYCLIRDKITSEMLEQIILKELEWRRMRLFLQF